MASYITASSIQVGTVCCASYISVDSGGRMMIKRAAGVKALMNCILSFRDPQGALPVGSLALRHHDAIGVTTPTALASIRLYRIIGGEPTNEAPLMVVSGSSVRKTKLAPLFHTSRRVVSCVDQNGYSTTLKRQTLEKSDL